MLPNWMLVVTAVVGLVACGEAQQPVPEPESRPAKLITVSVGEKSFERIFPATTEAGDKAVLAFRVPGQLNELAVGAGQVVTKGQVLATLDDQEYKLLRSQARANYNLTNVQLKRMQTLIRDKVVSEQDFDQARANEKSARAVLEQAEANYSYTRLLAPFDGIISIVNVENHEYVAAKQGLMNIQSNTLLKVIFQLPDTLLNQFRDSVDLSANVFLDSFPDRSFPLTFQEINTEADRSTGSYRVTMVMERPEDLIILPGLSGNIFVTIPRSKPSVLPKTSRFTCGDNTCVWRVTNELTTEQVVVELNEQDEVISGLVDGDRIVLSGVQELEAGMKVREWIKERGL